MLSLIRRYEANNIAAVLKIMRFSPLSSTTSTQCVAQTAVTEDKDDIEFRVLELMPKEKRMLRKKASNITKMGPPKAEAMPIDQNWQAIWPTARTFQPHTVPLPLKQGYKNPKGMHPDKYANAELMKIPNFLHLTPPAIKKHCMALRRFCTKWPTELQTNEECQKHFPLQIISSNYCYSSPTIREPLARIVSLRVKLSSLHLDAHAKDKMLRLIGDKYNPHTDVITITADRCPTKKQNLDYVKYLLTALFHISWRVEPWETEKSEADMEYYDWDKNKSRKSLTTMYNWPNSPIDSSYEHIPHAAEYRTAVSDLINKGEDPFSINKYKQAVKNVLNLKFYENTE
ncbi:28S ribosomal protein S35, mitochondrial [Habropoda laboriosa]|uniref:28S ribosomal protein S35, mitochondrial n=1 Tax=Habropoda laboriosa TaxID=597456 RepID=A0A0L7QS73_9HYME|nr:PREDICTED: 28S ribosomal protein S35, mitochondrial [Habropoda laboriosa]KOC61483.1 28S ribosomal protein S35, mitochondrial [Habropoda laboriosa]